MTERSDSPGSPAALPTFTPLRENDGSVEVWVLSAHAADGGLHTRTCPQCGRNEAPTGGAPLVELVHLPPGVFVACGLSSWIGAVAYLMLRKSVSVRLPLCDACLEAHGRGQWIRRAGVVAFTLAPGPLTVLFPFLAPELVWSVLVWGVLAVVGGVGCIAAFRSTRGDVLRLAAAPRDGAPLALVASQTFGEVLAREQPDALAALDERDGRR